ncbi:MAG: hypothetical protein WC789_13790 [Lentisphaeria bacterium]
MSELNVMKARYAKCPTDEVSGITHCRWYIEPVAVNDPGGSGSTGRAATLTTAMRLFVELHGTDLAALLALIDQAAANCVVGYQASDGTLRKRTFKGVKFVECVQGLDVPPTDAPGAKPPRCGVRGIACTATKTDVLAQMIVDAAEA